MTISTFIAVFIFSSVISYIIVFVFMEKKQQQKNEEYKKNFDKWIEYLVEEDRKKREREFNEKYPLHKQLEILREIWQNK